MPDFDRLFRSLLVMSFAMVLLCGWTGPAAAQADKPTAESESNDTSKPQRDRYPFGDDDTSATNQMLENILNRYPEADKDKDGVLTAEEGKAFIDARRETWRGRRDSRQRRGKVRPTHADVVYGPDPKHTLDLYLAESDGPEDLTPLVVFFHGGQFIGGDKGNTGTLDIQALLSAGISVASVDYRAARYSPFPAPFDDAARAVQFLRLTAPLYNLDPEKFAGHGEEAGGNLALYLALHDDLASKRPTPDEELDALLGPDEEPEPWQLPERVMMSTRLTCAVARHPIASFDPRDWAKHRLPMNGHERLMKQYLDVRYLEPLDDEDVIALVEKVSPLALISRDDPELLLLSQYEDSKLTDDTTWTIMRHHPRQAQLIVQAMRAQGNQATVRYRGMKNDPRTSSIEFFIDKLK